MAARDEIPWSSDVEVTVHRKESGFEMPIEGIWLRKPDLGRAIIKRSGEIDIAPNSKGLINHYLKESKPMSARLNSLQVSQSSRPFVNVAKNFLLGDERDMEEGVLEWWPSSQRKNQVKLGKFGSGRAIAQYPNWMGNDLIYVHYELPSEEEEGLAIQWDDPNQEAGVWFGKEPSVAKFLAANIPDPGYVAQWNELLDNGIVWAGDKLNFFTQDPPAWFLELIEKDPDLLWPELVERLYPIHDRLPYAVEHAVLTWIARRQAEADQATGQRKFWSGNPPSMGANPFMNPRGRRLARDFEEMKELANESSILEFQTAGDPPDRYLLTFHGMGLGPDGPTDFHQVEMDLGTDYPRRLPGIRWKTPIQHPNISAGGPCLGEFSMNPGVRLVDLVELLWDMNRMAIATFHGDKRWETLHQKYGFPLDPRILRDKAPRKKEEPGDDVDLIILGRR